MRYMQHFLNHMRTMLLVQPRPPLDAWVVQAEAELAQSHTAAPRSFRWLKALVCRFDDDMAKTSAHLLLEANDHAAAVGVMGHILAIINAPDRAADAIGHLTKGQTLAAARILEFHRLFGVSLIDINSLLQLGDRKAA